MKKMAAFLMAFTLVCTSSPADLHTGRSNRNRLYSAGSRNQFRGRSGCNAGESGWKLLSGERYHN